MKKITLILLILIGIGSAKAQEYKKIDSCSTIFIYSYQFYDEHKNPESLKLQDMVLEVGKKYSKFCSETTLYTDSLIMLHANDSPDAAIKNIYSQIRDLPSHIFSSYSIYKGYPEANTTLFSGRDLGAAGRYNVSEEIDFSWKIDNSAKKKILGMSCTKATCSYGGRDYEAWFTTEIPINDGPYKFKGLPGLILRIADSENEHAFELQEIKNINRPIYYVDHKPMKTDAKGYAKALEASKVTHINRLNSISYSDDAMRVKAIAKVQRRNNFIEKY